MEKVINIGGRLHNPVVGGAVTGANEIKDDIKGKMQNVINTETDAELVRLDEAKQEKLTFDQIPTENSTNPVTSGGVYAADAALQQAIEAILLLIPSAASALNQLADKAFVNSSISTATATFRGTYNLVTDLGLTVSATHAQIATALASEVSTADNNDYCFVQIPVSDQSQLIRVTERYKFNGTAWSYEYDLNNSGFTAEQWAAINSGITTLLVTKLGALPTVAELATMFAGKQNTLTFDTTPVNGSANPVTSGGLYAKFAAIEAMTPSDADANNKLVAENRLAAYVANVIGALDASYNITSADGHVTFKMTQADGAITSVQILTDDIASASALTTLGGRISTAEADIGALQDAYAALTQSDVVIVEGALPSSGQQQNIIYRQPDQEHTPPQYYSDYMWNGTTWVLMATYMNGIDQRPKKGSQNLVTSGGVFDNMGALDVSELNATENPHTLTPYVDLSAALAAIPSDYQKGGMSIKFIQGSVGSSDNKYVQYRFLLSGSFTDAQFADEANWAVMEGDIYIENPEFLYVFRDKTGGILWAMRVDGDILYGAGVPIQIQDYITEQINLIKNGSSGTDIDGINKIIAFLKDFSTSNTLKALLDTKVDKEVNKSLMTSDEHTKLEALPTNQELTSALNNKVDKITGKSLIDADFSECISSEENPEFSDLLLNEQGQIVASVNKDGEVYINPVDKRTILQKFLDEEGLIKGEQIDSFEFVGEPFTILSTDDEDVTLYDNFTFGFASQVKVHNHLYYMYYEAYGDNSEHTQGGDPSELGTNIVFAYSTDGFTWHRGFPSGVTPPNPGTNIIGIIDGDGVNLTSHVTEHQVFMVNDDVYPFRMIANHNYGNTAYTCLWKSADGFNFSHYKQIIKATDTQLCAIPRGQVIKVYCRDYDWYEDGTRKFEPNGRRIGVFYIDFDGNLLSPRKVLFGKALYQASAHVLDDHREILFPTEYGIYGDDSQRVKCYIVDDTLIKELPIDDSLLTDDYEMKSIYINSGLLNINYKQYMIYKVSKRKHNSSWNPNPTNPVEFRMIEVKLK